MNELAQLVSFFLLGTVIYLLKDRVKEAKRKNQQIAATNAECVAALNTALQLQMQLTELRTQYQILLARNGQAHHTLTKEELKLLRNLVHPDKNQGKHQDLWLKINKQYEEMK